MANEDEKIVADYMGWTEISVEDPMNRGVFEYILLKHNNCEAHFDLNDVAICVQEMQKRGEWVDFYLYFICLKVDPMERRISEMLIAKNFFGAMAAWIKERKK